MNTNAQIWQALTGPNSAALWQLFSGIAAALGHPGGAKLIQEIAAVAPVIGAALPPHPEAAAQPG